MTNRELLKFINHIDTLQIDKKVWEEHLIRDRNYWTNLAAEKRSKKQRELIQELKDSHEARILEKIYAIENEIRETEEKYQNEMKGRSKNEKRR